MAGCFSSTKPRDKTAKCLLLFVCIPTLFWKLDALSTYCYDEFSAQVIAPALIDRFHKTLFSLEDRPGYIGGRNQAPARPFCTNWRVFPRRGAKFSPGAKPWLHHRPASPSETGNFASRFRRHLESVCFVILQFSPATPVLGALPTPHSPTALCPRRVDIRIHRLAVRSSFLRPAGCAGRRKHHGNPAVGSWQGKTLQRCRRALHQELGRAMQAPS